MKSIQDLAREAGAAQQGRHWIFNSSDLERFHTLVIEQEHKRLLEGSGEPVAYRTEDSTNGVSLWLFKKTAVKYQDPPDNLYTAEQMAAAVLKERARCATICDTHETVGNLDPKYMLQGVLAAAIRGQR